jgi:hypothetical protein
MLIQYIIKNYEHEIISEDFQKVTILEQIKSGLEHEGKTLNFNKLIKKFILVKNFPLELYADLFHKNYLKQENNLLNEIKNFLIQNVLGSNSFRQFLIFYWEDGTGDNFKYHSERLFGKEILQHHLTENIR